MKLEIAMFVVEAIDAADTGAGATTRDVAKGVRTTQRTALRQLTELLEGGYAQGVEVNKRGERLWSLTASGQHLLAAARL